MKKIFVIVFGFATLIGCTEAGEGSDNTADSTAKKDSMLKVNEDASNSSKDTASYERMPNKIPDSTKK